MQKIDTSRKGDRGSSEAKRLVHIDLYFPLKSQGFALKAIKVIFKSSYSLRGLFLSSPFHPSLRSVCQAHSSTLSSISPFGRNRVIFNLYIQFSHNIFLFSILFPYNIQFSSSLHSLRSFRFVALSFRDTSEFSLRSTSSDPSLGFFRFLQSLTLHFVQWFDLSVHFRSLRFFPSFHLSLRSRFHSVSNLRSVFL